MIPPQGCPPDASFGGGRKKRRANCHDYHLKGTYHLVLEVNSRRPLLGSLLCDPKPRVALSHIGERLLSDELPEGRTLGNVVKGFKTGCNKMLRLQSDLASRSICGRHEGLFERGYYDQILFKEDASHWFAYLDDNPRRAVLKRQRADLFRVVNEVEILGMQWQMVGNCFLLDNPDRACVIVRSFWNEEEYDRRFAEWMYWGEHGGVLVSAAISQREKKVMRDALDRGYNVIYIKEHGFGPYYKPSGEAFDACAAGRLLMMTPYPYSTRKVILTRAHCMEMNRLAALIAGGGRIGIMQRVGAGKSHPAH